MTDGTDQNNTGAGRKPLTLSRTTSGGTVRQSFSHGRTKAVTVEVKEKRVITRPPAPGAAPPPAAARPAPAAPAAAPRPAAPNPAPPPAAAAPRPAERPPEQPPERLVERPAPAPAAAPALAEAPIPAPAPPAPPPPTGPTPGTVATVRTQPSVILPPPVVPAPPPAPPPVKAPAPAPAHAAAAPPRPAAPRPGAAPARPSGAGRPGGRPALERAAPGGLSQDESRRRQEAVQRALLERSAREARLKQEEEERRSLEDAQRRRVEEDAAAAAEIEARRQAEAEAAAAEERRAAVARGAEAPARRPGGDAPAPAPAAAAAAAAATSEEAAPARNGLLAELGGRVKAADRRPMTPAVPAKPPKKGEPKRREGKLTLDMVERITEGDDEKVRSLAAMRRAREKEKERRMKLSGQQDAAKVVRDVVVPETISVQDLANRMAERLTDVIKYMMRQGQMVRGADMLDADTAELIVADFGHTVKRVAASDVEIGLEGDDDSAEALLPRPPVVTIMGHVDHGKTSLLDALRSTDVVAGEAGGITQHIGAYQVRLADGQRVTFLDTPGHAAFSAMRARGAQVTDIVVLVVAADDGVMPQTIEAISHAKAAGVPIIVAVNKIDKPEANPQKVLNELLQYEILTEAVGGDTLHVEVSALKRINLDKLVETILLQAEVLNLAANPDRSAEALVVESRLDRGRGTVATVLVKRGTLRRGDIVVAGAQWGRVRALMDERGQALQEAGPSLPAELMGLEGVPEPGDKLVVVESETRAREVANYRQELKRTKSMVGAGQRTSLEQMMAKIKDNSVKELAVVIKADVQGSAEAIAGALEKISTEEVRARVLQASVGAINEADVTLAKASGAPIIGFNVRASKEARELAEREGVEIRYYNIIYDVIDDIKGVLSGMLAPITRETFLGNAEVLEVFDISKVGKVAGCRVTEGTVKRGAKVRIVRENVVIVELGTLSTLRRFKDDVAEVVVGQECGMSFAGHQDIKKGDLIECFNVEVVQRTL